jgi:hypothetical protein
LNKQKLFHSLIENSAKPVVWLIFLPYEAENKRLEGSFQHSQELSIAGQHYKQGHRRGDFTGQEAEKKLGCREVKTHPWVTLYG